MANKPFNTRIQLKHDTEANWIKAVNFKPLMSELIVYDVDATHTSPRFKVGDGTTNVNDLPFVTTECVETDPTVPAWAKAATKPIYTAAEVGALSTPILVSTSNSSDSDALTCNSNYAFNRPALVFVILKENMLGTANATIQFGSNTPIPIKIGDTMPLKAPYPKNTILGLIYFDSDFFVINPPIIL